MESDSLYYIMDYSGHYYRTNKADTTYGRVYKIVSENGNKGSSKKAAVIDCG